jgi:hypothetical protein
MSTLTFRGDAPAVQKVVRILKPEDYVSGVIEIAVNNKTISYSEWDAQKLCDAWNNSGYYETQRITASVEAAVATEYGSTPEGILLTANIAGEDFFVTPMIDGATKTDEYQKLVFYPEPSGGTFTLTFDGQTTGAITFNPEDASTTGANIKSALEALSNIAVGDVSVITIDNFSFYVKFDNTYNETDVPLMTCNYSGLTGGDVELVVVTTQNGVLPTNEVQTLSLPSVPTGGTFTLTFSGQTTGAIAYNANAATVQAALEALSNIAPGDVTCTGGALPVTAVVITFGGTYAATNVPIITGSGASLTGGTANVGSVTTVATGAAPTTQPYQTYAKYPSASSSVTFKFVTVDTDGNQESSADIAYSASAATIKAALVGMVIGYRVSAIGPTYEDYIITTDDIDVTGTLSSPGGFTITSKVGGNYQNRTFQPLVTDSPGYLPGYVYLVPSISSSIWNSDAGGDSGVLEQQKYVVTNPALSGQYTLSVYDTAGVAHTTAPINYSEADASTIRAIINTALGKSAVDVTVASVSGSVHITLYYINYEYQGFNMTQLTVADGSVQVIETTKGDPGTQEIQRITATATSLIRSGTFTITYDGQTTAALNYDDTALEIQTALEALSNIAVNDVTVSGAPIKDDHIYIAWKASLGNVNPVTATSSLDDATLEITEYLTGGVSIYAEEIVRNKGPECFDDANNYNPRQIPSKADTIFVEFGAASIRWGTQQRDTFEVFSISNNVLELSTKRPLFQNGQRLLITSSTTAPGGLSSGSYYYVINADNRGRFQLSTSESGTAINITDAGTGTHTIQLHLASIIVPARFNNELGLPRIVEGTEEYRPRYLAAAIDVIQIGERDGSGSPLIRIDTGDEPTSVLQFSSGSSSEPEVKAVGLLINDATSDIKAYGGEMSLAPFLDEAAVVRDIEIYNTQLLSVGGTTCRNIKVSSSSDIKGNFTPSGSVDIGV